MTDDRLYLRQLLSGRDFAVGDPLASQMVNFSYLLGDSEERKALIVDPTYDPVGLLDIAASDGMEVEGVLLTHYHADHAGGNLFGYDVPGLAALLDYKELPVHVQRDELDWVVRSAGVGAGDLSPHEPGDSVTVGGLSVELIHTPGHTPGSQCFLAAGRLVSGDTLFLNGCGRTDLPGSDPEAMYESLHQRLMRLPAETIVYPGHLYSPEASASLEEVRRTNPVLRPATPEAWLSLFGR